MTGAFRARLPYAGLFLLVWGLDRWTKELVQASLPAGASRRIIDGFFDLTHLHNPGVAFGLWSGEAGGYRMWVLSGIALAAAVVVVVYSFRTPVGETGVQAALALILGGTLGNLYDRLTQGHVTDFLYFYWKSWYWPAFNVADTAITTGVGLLALGIVLDDLRRRR